MKTTIYLDTSFLLDILKFKINLDAELKRICDFDYELKTYDLIMKELKGKKQEKLAKAILKKKNIELLKTQEGFKTLDQAFLDLKNSPVIATNDQGLKRLLKSKHIKILTIRQKRYLMLY